MPDDEDTHRSGPLRAAQRNAPVRKPQQAETSRSPSVEPAPEAAPAHDDEPLRDILEASKRPHAPIPSGVAAESIVDTDNRRRITNTSQFPFSAIAALDITARDGSHWMGTGWFISERTLITAGHCVYIHDARFPAAEGWVKSILVIPGRNGTGDDSEPLGKAATSDVQSVNGWVTDASAESDYGAIFLPDSTLGARAGQFTIGAFGDDDLWRLTLNIAGYPGDKTGVEKQTMWFDAQALRGVTPRQLFYDVDTVGGQSGAPVYVMDGDKRVAVAVHAYGTGGAVASNSGTRITDEVRATMEAWKR
jgi:V8-like Glu-specific endopeptidase